MRRREFIAWLGGAAASPLAARAQQTSMPVIGFLNSASPGTFTPFVNAFRDGLKQAGFVESQNVRIEYRWAYGKYDQLGALATDLVSQHVDVIAATGGDVSAQAAKFATTTVPVVFSISGDPVRTGLVASLNRPGGNLTGRTNFGSEVTLKRLQLLRELVPTAGHVAILANPDYPITAFEVTEIETQASAIGLRGPVTEAAIGNDRLVRRGATRFEQFSKLRWRFERCVFGDQILEMKVPCSWDVTEALASVIGRARRTVELAAVFFRRAVVQDDRRFFLQRGHHIIPHRSHPYSLRIVDWRVSDWADHRYLGRERPPLLLPARFRTIEHAHIVMTAVAKDPPGICAELHRWVAIADHAGVIADACCATPLGEKIRRRKLARSVSHSISFHSQ